MSELSVFRTKDESGIRLYPMEEDFRTSFARDIDKIINYRNEHGKINSREELKKKKILL